MCLKGLRANVLELYIYIMYQVISEIKKVKSKLSNIYMYIDSQAHRLARLTRKTMDAFPARV